MLTKSEHFHHSVTELANIQVRYVSEYSEMGEARIKKYGKPMAPADPKDMTGWDDRSKDIVAAIIAPTVKLAFNAEKQTMIGVGIEEIVTYDRVIEKDCEISVRRITRIFDEGTKVSKRFHRSWIMPGDDLTGKDIISKVVAQKLHTTEIVVAYKAKQAKQVEESGKAI